jgi:hypothetical protein
VGNLEADRQIEPHDIASEDAEASVLAPLEARLEEQLEAHTDPQKRLIGEEMLANRLDEPAGMKGVHRIAKRTHPWQDKALGGGDDVRIARDCGRGTALLDSFLDAS